MAKRISKHSIHIQTLYAAELLDAWMAVQCSLFDMMGQW
jgi:hypothetical protein